VGYSQLTGDGREKMETIVSDGSRLYLCEHDRFRRTLSQVSTAGGEAVPMSTPLENPLLADISPNGTELLVFAGPFNEKLQGWIVPLPGGSPRRLADVRGGHGAWSPDGQQVAYVNGPDLFIVKTDGSGARKVATAKGDLWAPRWSPDGARLRFNVNGEDSVAIWEVRADGTNLHQLFAGWNTPPNEADGSWTPDGRYFVFLSSRKGRKRDIWAVRETRGLFETRTPEPVQLTSGPMDFWRPTPSRDGKTIFAVASQGRGEVVRYDVATRQFVIYQSGLSAEGLAFSRDGQWMSYVTYPERLLWRSRVDGSERLQLTFPPMQPLMAEWSPDGRQLAFTAHVPPKWFKIYVVSTDGGTPQPVVPGDRQQHDPAWSANGRSLAFGQGEVFSTEAPDHPPAIYQLDLKTRDVVKIPGSEGMWHPRWSPDGRHLIAQTAPDQRTLMLFDPRTQSWVEWVRGEPWTFAYSTWSRDSQYIYYESSGHKEPGLFRLRVRDRKIEELGSLKNIRQGGNMPMWMGLAPDDSPLVMRNLETQEIYALDFRAP
jgi:Tol biopolymer transport system component